MNGIPSHDAQAAAPVPAPSLEASVRLPEVSVGCDAQDVRSIEESLADFGERYLRRVLSAGELERAASLPPGDRLAAYVAGRFAAKEAVFKTLRAGPDDALPWPDIEIRSDATGAPVVRLHGHASRLAARAGVSGLSVSISHAAGFAFAVATAVIPAATSAPSL